MAKAASSAAGSMVEEAVPRWAVVVERAGEWFDRGKCCCRAAAQTGMEERGDEEGFSSMEEKKVRGYRDLLEKV
jgi:hypothetical protein